MEEIYRIEREILDAFYKIAIDFRSGVIDDNELKERILQAARRYERALGTAEPHPGEGHFAWRV